MNEIVLWAGVWVDSWQIVSVLGAGRSCLGSWGWYVAAVCQGVLGQEERAAGLSVTRDITVTLVSRCHGPGH